MSKPEDLHTMKETEQRPQKEYWLRLNHKTFNSPLEDCHENYHNRDTHD